MLEGNGCVGVVLTVEAEMGAFGIRAFVDGEFGCVLEVWDWG